MAGSVSKGEARSNSSVELNFTRFRLSFESTVPYSLVFISDILIISLIRFSTLVDVRRFFFFAPSLVHARWTRRVLFVFSNDCTFRANVLDEITRK